MSTAAELQPEIVTFRPRELWSNVFGGAEVVQHFTLSAGRPWQGRVQWRVAIDNRTLRAGEAAVEVSPARSGEVQISFSAPPVNPGVIMQARLTVALAEAGRPDGASTFEKDFWIFPAEPFENRQEWLRDLDITLFDPDQKTAAVLEEHKLPFTLTQNPDALAAKQQGLIVVGEGVSFRDYPALAAILMRRASVGVPVLILAPAPRSFFETALGEGDSPRPRQVTLGGPEMIRQIDKRLDAAGWAPEGRIVASSLKLSGERSRIVADVVEGDRDWSWLEIRYGEDRPQALFCGFAIVEQWPHSPAPRYLLLALLERLTGSEGDAQAKVQIVPQ